MSGAEPFTFAFGLPSTELIPIAKHSKRKACISEHALPVAPSKKVRSVVLFRESVFAVVGKEFVEFDVRKASDGVLVRSPQPKLSVSVRSLACSGNHVLALTTSGQVMAWGDNTHGQLGLGHCNSVVDPEAVQVDGRASDIAAGGAHSLLVSDGKVFACGSNDYGQLGLAHSLPSASTPAQITTWDASYAAPTISNVAAGLDFSMFLSAEGLVYTCGRADTGAVGLDLDIDDDVADTRRRVSVPRVVPGLLQSTIRKIVARDHHCCAVTKGGRLYVWGSNSEGALGTGAALLRCNTPYQVKKFRNIKIRKISLGPNHSAAVSNDGQLYTWGSCIGDALGHGSLSNVYVPLQVRGARCWLVKDVWALPELTFGCAIDRGFDPSLPPEDHGEVKPDLEARRRELAAMHNTVVQDFIERVSLTVSQAPLWVYLSIIVGVLALVVAYYSPTLFG